ncbi:hypothetical protein SAMN05216460_1021 [Streptococcus sp. 45]|uniref:Uncharacterized protein n=1 Tax=Streptococcus equinus TaxID=1335 RepID=A0A1H0MB41_STREI|nr:MULTISPECIES: hypothetical protein [Streptococcus]SDO77597.1 hypothetical protein SAMN05216347_102269 [Streptococcus equinus]SEI61588.1 hypothetical protein SAMN05216460_1021 [Streptococcus sp. 45]
MIEKAIIKQTHLVKKTVRIAADQLPDLFEYTEYLPFEFGIYKDGPTFFEITPCCWKISAKRLHQSFSCLQRLTE